MSQPPPDPDAAGWVLRLRPVAWPGQWTDDYSLSIDPQPQSMQERSSPWPVHVVRLLIENPLREIRIESRFRAGVSGGAIEPQAGDPTIGAVAAAALLDPAIDPSAPARYLYASPRIPLLAEIDLWTGIDLSPDRPVIAAALALARRIQGEFSYDPDATDAATPTAEAFAARHGVCQDFAHVMVAALRLAGLPAAYVSGYLRTDPPPGMPRLVGADAMHAWVMLWCGPTRGWIGFDPTSWMAARSLERFLAALGLGGAVGAAFALAADMIRQATR